MLKPATSTAPEPIRRMHVSDVDILQTLFPWWPQHPNWLIELRFLEDRTDGVKNPPVAVKYLRDPSEITAQLREHRILAAQRAQDLQQGRSSAWPAGLFCGAQPRLTRRGGRENVAAYVTVTCTIACSDRGEWPEKERPRVIWEALHACPHSPSVITWTGHGFDAWWLLREPVFNRHCGEQVEKSMANYFHTNHATNAAALVRWPQSVNYQGLPVGSPQTVRVIWWQPALRHSLAKLNEVFLPYAPPTGSSDPGETVTWKQFQHLMREHVDFRTLWTRDHSDCTATQQHSLNVLLANFLAMHDAERSDFRTVAARAPWNAIRPPTAAELLKAWQEARGDDGTGDLRRPTIFATHQTATQAAQVGTPPSPAPAPSATAAMPAGLPGLLLGTLPQSVCPEWAHIYLEAVGSSTEAAHEFHFLALLTIMGAAFGRNLMVCCGGRPVYSNMYTILVGPTGDRKSTAAELALDVLHLVASPVLVLNGVGSQEGLMERMAAATTSSSGPHPTLWYVDEMAALLKKARRESSGGLIEFITEVFHCPEVKNHFTRSKSFDLKQPTLSILAGSTPTWLEAGLNPDDILGGFANRFAFVTGTLKDDNPLPRRPDAQAIGRLVLWIQRVVQTPAREIGWTPAAQGLWAEFYFEWRRSTSSCGEVVAALLRRIDHYITKFAAMFAAMEETNLISRAHLSAAIEIGRYLAGCAYRLLGDLGASIDCRLETLVVKKLEEAGGELRRKLLRQTLGGRVSGEKLDRVLNAMERNGLVRQITDGSSKLVQLT